MVVWSKELCLEFLQLYEARPVVWNPKHPEHKSKTAVRDAWTWIEANLSVRTSVAELKKKKDSLMSSFRKRLKDTRGVRGKCNWFAYDAMSRFLLDVYRLKRATAAWELQSSTENNTPILHADNSTENLMDTSEESSEPGNSENSNKISESDGKKQLLDKIEKLESKTNTAYKFSKQLLQITTNKDDCSLYTDLLCNKLRSLDEDAREMVMLEIDTIVHRIKHLGPQALHSKPLFLEPSFSYQNNHLPSMQPSNEYLSLLTPSFQTELSPSPPLQPLLFNDASLNPPSPSSMLSVYSDSRDLRSGSLMQYGSSTTSMSSN